MSSSGRRLIFVKKPRLTPLVDKPKTFPPLDNLHFELLECKRKLKPNLPLLAIRPFKKKIVSSSSEKNYPSQDSPEDEKALSRIRADDYDDRHRSRDDSHRSRDDDRYHRSHDEDRHRSRDDDYHRSSHRDDDRRSSSRHRDEDDGRKSADDDLVEKMLGTREKSEERDYDRDRDSHRSREEYDNRDSQQREEPKEEVVEIGELLSPEEKELKEKEELLLKFKLLKMQYKDEPLDEFNEHSDIELMRRYYRNKIQEIRVTRSLRNYRRYLMLGFMGVEYVFTKMIGIDFTDFTKEQSRMMDDYDVLLAELAEKEREQWKLNWPVELRLIGVVLFNAALFYIGKLLYKNGEGGMLSEIFDAMSGLPPRKKDGSDRVTEVTDDDDPKKKRKMRGPKIRAEDIRNR